MIPIFILNWIVSTGRGRVTERGARWLVYIAAATVLLTLVAVLVARRDTRMIQRHDSGQEVQVLETTGAANENASIARRADDAVLVNETSEVEKVIRDAPKPTAPASAARAAYYRCVGLQQQARNAGKPTPKC